MEREQREEKQKAKVKRAMTKGTSKGMNKVVPISAQPEPGSKE